MRDSQMHCERAQNSDKEETLLQPPSPKSEFDTVLVLEFI